MPPTFKADAVHKFGAYGKSLGFQHVGFTDHDDFRLITHLLALYPEGGELRIGHGAENDLDVIVLILLDQVAVIGGACGVEAGI